MKEIEILEKRKTEEMQENKNLKKYNCKRKKGKCN